MRTLSLSPHSQPTKLSRSRCRSHEMFNSVECWLRVVIALLNLAVNKLRRSCKMILVTPGAT